MLPHHLPLSAGVLHPSTGTRTLLSKGHSNTSAGYRIDVEDSKQ